MRPALPPSPTEKEWAHLGFADAVELAGGKQSRVFAARAKIGPVAVKLTDATIEADGDLMGASLARLHGSMRRVSGVGLPNVDALRAIQVNPSLCINQPQPLHGDFNSSNLLRTPTGLRVFDFDDCGNGPVEFDVANTLYMVLFDSLASSQPTTSYDSFRTQFVDGYAQETKLPISPETIDSLIDLRVRALDHWITNLADAPIGIRSSSPAWIDVLKQFVKTWSELS